MRLTEEQAARIVLVRSIEECDASAFSADVLAAAVDAAKHEKPGLGWVERRAAYLFDRLSDGYRSVCRLAKLPTPWTIPVCAIALVLGLATNLLGPADKIHVIRNPVFVLVAWNVLIYVTLFAVSVLRMLERSAARARNNPWVQTQTGSAPISARPRATIHRPKIPWSIRLVLPRLWRVAHENRFAGGDAKIKPELVGHFAVNWFMVARPLVVARWRRLLHLGALFLAVGAVAGMYGRGLLQDYEVVWTSTFVRRQETISTILGILFRPSLLLSDLAGFQLSSEINVPRLLSADGDQADAWIHLFAMTVLIAVVIPRASLAFWQSLRIAKLRRALALPLDSYYGHAIEGPLRSAIEEAVETAGKEFARNVASFIVAKLYDEQIVPVLHKFRKEGGRLADLRSEIKNVSDAFLPQLNHYIANVTMPQLQSAISQRVGEVMKSVGTDFVQVTNADQVLRDLEIPAAQSAELGIAGSVSKAVGISIGTALSITLATIGGGLGHHLGIAIIATLLGTTGPVGFLIGLIIGAVVTAGAWLYGRDKLTEAIEKVYLPGPGVRAALWESRFHKLIEDGRTKFAESAQENVVTKFRAVVPTVTDQVLARVRLLWAS